MSKYYKIANDENLEIEYLTVDKNDDEIEMEAKAKSLEDDFLNYLTTIEIVKKKVKSKIEDIMYVLKAENINISKKVKFNYDEKRNDGDLEINLLQDLSEDDGYTLEEKLNDALGSRDFPTVNKNKISISLEF